MDVDFAVSRPLVRRSRLISGFCPSTRTFAPRFLQTSPRGDSPCVITSPSPPSGWAEDFHLQAAEHAQHTTKPLSRRTLRVGKGSASIHDRNSCFAVGVGVGSFPWTAQSHITDPEDLSLSGTKVPKHHSKSIPTASAATDSGSLQTALSKTPGRGKGPPSSLAAFPIEI